MGEIKEEFINGFCRTANEPRTVCCEYGRRADGTWELTGYECNVDKCPNSAACQIYKEAREKERGSGIFSGERKQIDIMACKHKKRRIEDIS